MQSHIAIGHALYLLTDAATADMIVESGLMGTRLESQGSAVVLLDRVPQAWTGAVVRVSLSPTLTVAAWRHEQTEPGAEHRTFLVPRALLAHAHLVRVMR